MARKKPAAPAKDSLEMIHPELRQFAVPVESLNLDPENARAHDAASIAAIAESMNRFGQDQLIIVQKSGLIVRKGNGRLMAARQLGWSHVAAVVVDEAEPESIARAISDNQVGLISSWDLPNLLKAFEKLGDGAKDVPGFDELTIGALAAALGGSTQVESGLPPPGRGGDEFDPTPDDKPCRVGVGDVWEATGGGLTHRLMCGDSADPLVVGRLMDGKQVGVVFTSPPYLAQRVYGGGLRPWDSLMQGVFSCMPLADDAQVLVNLGLVHKDGELLPYWNTWVEWMRTRTFKHVAWYVWDKGTAGRTDGGRLPTEHEWVFHFASRAVTPMKVDPCKHAGRTAMHIPQYSRDTGPDRLSEGDRDKEVTVNDTRVRGSVCHVNRGAVEVEAHPAIFPVALVDYFVGSWPGSVYDPFAGSFVTMISAHRLGRESYGMDVEPRYVEVGLRRAEAEGLEVRKVT